MFEMIKRDGLARICRLEIHGKEIETPALLPVVNPKCLSIPPPRMSRDFGFSAIITNSFIISRDAELRERALSEGLHDLLGFDGMIMTDSGTFQEHVYGDTEVDPIEIVEFQRNIGSDIGTILDVFSEPDFGRDRAKNAVDTTVARAREAAEIRGDMWLSGPVQGSLFEDLRTECAKELSSVDLQVHPIGGVVPLMESYRFPDLVNVVIASKKGLDPSRPVHLFGAGHPMLFPLAVLLGCDLFDSASYAKFARDGRMMFADGTHSIEDIEESWCDCPSCSNTSLNDLRKMGSEDRERLIAEHNLRACQSQLRRVRSAIKQGTLWELVEQTCRSHPRLLDALRTLPRHNEFLERYEPLSRTGALMFTGSESYDRPAIWRYRRRFFERYSHPRTEMMITLPEGKKPYSRTYAHLLGRINAHFVIWSSIGPVPIELDEIYPISHIFNPERIDDSARSSSAELMERFSHEQKYGISILWEGDETLGVIDGLLTGLGSRFDLDQARIAGILSMQFDRDAVACIDNAMLSYVKSKNTGRIRNVSVGGAHAFSIRATDGYISLTDEGARILHGVLEYPSYRVKIESDAVPFVKEGSNVFAKFVLDADPDIRPGDEVLIVDDEDSLIGHGRCVMNREEMLAFRRGMAVRTRSHADLTDRHA